MLEMRRAVDARAGRVLFLPLNPKPQTLSPKPQTLNPKP